MAFLALLLLILATLAMSIESTNLSNNVAKPGCQTKCGNLTVPYAFGIGIDAGCSIDSSFDISYSEPIIDTSYRALEVIDISTSQIRIRNMLASLWYKQNGELVDQKATLINTEVSSFTLSEKDNRLLLIGCSDVAMGSGYLFYEGTNFRTGCMTRCSSGKDVSNSGNCSGIGCCQAAILVIGNHTAVWSFNPCSYAFLGEHEKFKFKGASDFMDPNFERRIVNDVPIVLDWAIGTQNCSEVRNSTANSCVLFDREH
ncbi:hypothetical protein BC332_13817 [Capsicum chinense]|nr:hypothetical protein BC332_13817 [Capsicum chinense]